MLDNFDDGVKVNSVVLLVGDNVMFEVNVGLDVSKLVGALDCESDIEKSLYVVSNVGNSVVLLKFKVGRIDNSKLVGLNVFDNVGGDVKANAVIFIVGEIVILKANVGLDVSKLAGKLVIVGNSVMFLLAKVGLGESSILVGADVFSPVEIIVGTSVT